MVKSSLDTFVEKMNELMESKGINTTALAKASDVSISTIRKARLRKACPTIETAEMIAKGLGTSLVKMISKAKKEGE